MATPLSDVLPDLSQFIILGYRGSHAHGMFVPSTDPDSIDDVDLMGVVIPPLDTYLGLKSWHGRGTQEIKQDEWDIVNYEIRKVFGMLLGSNPNMAALLWADPDHYIVLSDEGQMLRDNRNLFSSKKAYHTFTGYAYEQLRKLESPNKKGYMGEKRRALFEKFGYDAKNAAHCIRLLRMGTEFLTDGVMRLNRQGIDAAELLSIKRGEWELSRIKEEAEKWFEMAKLANQNSPLPAEPDEEAAHDLLMTIMMQKFSQEFVTAISNALLVSVDQRPLCDGCGNEIDPEWCWCGGPRTPHGFVPMGCDCMRNASREYGSEVFID
jgi:predicted nucleotidyltransferase